jgi:hypothetical protein
MTPTRRLTRSAPRIAFVLGLASIASVPSLAQAPAAKIPHKLVDEVVFFATVPDNNEYDADVRRELQQFRQRVRSYRPRPRPARLSGEMRMVYAAREGYEGKLVASGGAGTELLAHQFVDELKPCYEWEGFHDCPENEAKFAEQYLAKNPNTPFRELLPLLAANRWFCAAEGYEMEERPQDAARSRKASAAQLAVALKSQSLLIRTAAQELRTRGRCHAVL